MKKSGLLLAATLLFLALSASRAATVTGTVFCDANQDGIIDTGDVGIPGVIVVITNQDNSFSNSAVTATDGSFSIDIPNPAPTPTVIGPPSQVFIETLDPASLPDGSSIVIPATDTNLTATPAYVITYAITPTQTNLVFLSGSGTSTNSGDWLINNPNCGSVGNCRVTGRARIATGNRGDHSFGGKIVSGSPPSGSWTDTSGSLGLRFTSTSIQSVICGIGSIQFSGTGLLGGGKGFRRSGVPVQFTASIQILSTTGKGNRTRNTIGYYLNVTTLDGTTTLMLVSTDPADPTDIAPVAVNEPGNLRLVSGE